LARGLDPIAERQAQKAEDKPVTFGEAADELIAEFRPSWRNPKHVQQWENTIATYCKDILSKPVAHITTDDVLAVLRPIWSSKPETASRLRGRIESVLSQARVRRWRQSENVAVWRGHLEFLLPDPRKRERRHHTALPYTDVPAFYARLREKDVNSAHALRFLILTAARTSEVTGAVWSEIDLDARLWVVPGRRMKGAREHRQPLSNEAVAILRQMEAARTCDLVFTGTDKRGKPAALSNMAMQMLIRRMKVDATVHGMRSAFRDWTAEETTHANEIAEMALAHAIGNKVERAYRRGDLLERRRALMEDWAAFVAPSQDVDGAA
jgi:integrase